MRNTNQEWREKCLDELDSIRNQLECFESDYVPGELFLSTFQTLREQARRLKQHTDAIKPLTILYRDQLQKKII
jgi:hypothetical protein